MLGSLLVNSACLIFIIGFFYTRITRPLNSVRQGLDEILRFNLKVSFPPTADPQANDLSTKLNEIAANIQEILLITGTSIGNIREKLENIHRIISDETIPFESNEIHEQLSSIETELELLESVVHQFKLYRATFDGRKVLSAE